MILLIGCGKNKLIRKPSEGVDYSAPVTLDIDPDTIPDVLWDLNNIPYPFEDNQFSEIHAYEVLEHCGTQGDWKYFFSQFMEFWRMLKPGGKFIFSVPAPYSLWVWGDPGHTRLIHPLNLTYLEQKNYSQVGSTAMTDYRHIYSGDFEIKYCDFVEESTVAVIEAIK